MQQMLTGGGREEPGRPPQSLVGFSLFSYDRHRTPCTQGPSGLGNVGVGAQPSLPQCAFPPVPGLVIRLRPSGLRARPMQPRTQSTSLFPVPFPLNAALHSHNLQAVCPGHSTGSRWGRHTDPSGFCGSDHVGSDGLAGVPTGNPPQSPSPLVSPVGWGPPPGSGGFPSNLSARSPRGACRTAGAGTAPGACDTAALNGVDITGPQGRGGHVTPASPSRTCVLL